MREKLLLGRVKNAKLISLIDTLHNLHDLVRSSLFVRAALARFRRI